MPPAITLTFWLVTAFAVSLVGTFGLRGYSLRRGLLDQPNYRSSHTVPTPRLGGLAIALATVTGWLGSATFTDPSSAIVLAAATGGAVAAAVGWVDDLRSMSPAVKLAGEVVAALAGLALALWGAGTPVMPLVVVAVWLVTYMNLFNFMDGSDGLASGVAVCAALGFAALSGGARSGPSTEMALVVAAAAAGFLVFNFPPASIFMGDAGSLFLGYGLGILVYVLSRDGVCPVASALVLTPFLFDGGFTLVRRARRREILWHAHRSHLYQRLIGTGASHRHVALLYYVWTIWGSLLGWVWLTSPAVWRSWIIACALLPGGLLALHVQGREARRVPEVRTSGGR